MLRFRLYEMVLIRNRLSSPRFFMERLEGERLDARDSKAQRDRDHDLARMVHLKAENLGDCVGRESKVESCRKCCMHNAVRSAQSSPSVAFIHVP